MGSEAKRKGPVFELTGGRPCLDFANTARHKPNVVPRDDFKGYADLVSFCAETGLLDAGEAGRLRAEARRRPVEAEEALDRARALRGSLYRVFSRAAAGKAPQPRDLDAVGRAAAEGSARCRLLSRNGEFVWKVTGEAPVLDRPMWEAARSAVEVLVSPRLLSVRECALETCSWLFLDRSRNGKRRWCDMKICGNRAKARRHYRKLKADTSGGRSRNGREDHP
jgi:predicted RNA-binding Zn ribbon-like protein